MPTLPLHTLVILAAGIGRRFGGDKQWAAVGPGGESLLDYAVADAAGAGFRRALLVLRPDVDPRQAAELLARLAGRIGRAEAVFQRPEDLPGGRQAPPGRRKPWGTGQALLACRGAIDGPFAMVNADDYYGPASFVLAREALDRVDGGRCALVAFRLDRTLSEHGRVSRGVCRPDGQGGLADLVERQGIGRDEAGRILAGDGLAPEVLDPQSLVSMNLWAFPREVFDWLEADFGPFLDRLAAADPGDRDAGRADPGNRDAGRADPCDHDAGRIAPAADPKSPPAAPSDPCEAEFLLTEVLGARLRDGRLRAELLSSPETWLGLTNAADLAAVRARLAELRPGGPAGEAR